MSVREIRLFGDPVLKSRCRPVDLADPGVAGLVADLLDTVRLPGRAGVAANQIGVDLRAFSYHVDGVVDYVLNPVLVSVSGEPTPTHEGCLSVPELWYPVPRYPEAVVQGVNLAGESVLIRGTGLLAQALQHETDHLDGMLYLDRLERSHRGAAYSQIRAASWAN